MKKNHISKVVEIINENTSSDENYFSFIHALNKDFLKVYETAKKEIPYNVNLLDEVRVDENAHSRIFTKLLQYEHQGEFKLLLSFFDSLGAPFSELIIEKPIITTESNRIDARIKEKNKFSIIVENKINGAIDQYKQIERYIEIEKNEFGHSDKIFIIYLTSEGGSPSEGSLNEKTRQAFEKRYREINYRDDILPWIIHQVLPLIKRLKDNGSKMLESAVLQYKDYLEGRFYKREGERKMNEKMVKLIYNKLNLNEIKNGSEKIKIISEFKDYNDSLLTYLHETEKDILFTELNKFSKEICDKKNTIEGIKKIQSYGNFGEVDSSITFVPNEWGERYSINMSFNHELSGLFYAIGDSQGTYKTEKNPLILKLKKILGKNDEPNDLWLYSKWIIDDEEDFYNKLLNLIENKILSDFIKSKVIEIVNNNEVLNLLCKK